MTDGMIIDIWNEPDLSLFWNRDQDQYLQLWGRTYSRLRYGKTSYTTPLHANPELTGTNSAHPSNSPAQPHQAHLPHPTNGGSTGAPSSRPTSPSQTNTPGTWKPGAATCSPAKRASCPFSPHTTCPAGPSTSTNTASTPNKCLRDRRGGFRSWSASTRPGYAGTG
jgi:hypothetical protein